jgi:hypothetical protein
MPDVDQLVQLYFEADRSSVKDRYERLFGTNNSADAPTVLPGVHDDGSGDDAPPETAAEDQPDGDITHDDLDNEFGRLLGEFNVTDDTLEQVTSVWERFDLRTKIVAIDYWYALNDQGATFELSWEGLTRFFGVRAVNAFLHSWVPYVFPWNAWNAGLSYSQLRLILDDFGIRFDDSETLTEFEIWRNLSDSVMTFRENQKLESWQIWALVFDLGPRLLPKLPPYQINPPPRVWVVATNDSEGEFAEIDAHGSENVGTTAMNRNARRGDLALMYCVSPRSAIVSVYRVVEDAHRDPFGGWNGYRAQIAEKIPIPWITFREMKADPVLKTWKLVKGNFQGLLHYEVPENVWQRLLEIVSERDPDAGDRLKQFRDAGKGVREIKVAGEEWSEKEVEDRFVIPALQRMGWQLGTTLKQQVPMRIKVGSGKPREVLADFVGYSGALTSQALLVVEVKRRIKSTKELETAVEQAESYAGKQRCPRFAVASPEGFWAYELQFPGQSRQLVALELPSATIEHIASELQKVIGYEALRR